MYRLRSTPGSRSRPLRALAGTAVAVVVTLTAAPAGARAEEAREPGTVVGELVRAWPEAGLAADPVHGTDLHDETAEAPLSWVETEDGPAVRVPTEEVADLPVGATVQVTVGEELSDAAREDGYEPARDVLDAVVLDSAREAGAAGGTLTNEVTVAMVVPAGGMRDATTLAQVVTAVDGPVADFWAEQTGGAVTVGVTAAHDWITTRARCSDPTALWNEVAVQVGFVPGPGRHLAVYVSSLPRNLPGCSYALGQVGSGPGSGGRLYVRDVVPSVLAHELGHNFGLGHSSGRQCDGAVETGACRTVPYRDHYDVMGTSWAQVGTLNAAQASLLGVLPAAAQQSLPAAGPARTVTLAPFSGRSGTRALRLTDPHGVTYWLEYRTATGRDAWLGSPDNRFGLQTGVLLRRASAMPDTALLLDGTPATAQGWDADLHTALPLGVPVPVSGGNFTVTVEDLSAAGATVTVTTAAAGVVPTTPLDPAGSGTGSGTPDVLPATAAPAATPSPAGASPRTRPPAPDPAVAAGADRTSAGAASAPLRTAALTSTGGAAWTVPLLATAGLGAAVLGGCTRARRAVGRS